ncbi:MAG: tetratricopeptide repeat protein [Gammaproteobacteria bacterium]|jgi:tetratricopeptide (TPR) repeat protein
MEISNKHIDNSLLGVSQILRSFAVIALVLLVSACVTTGGGDKKQVKKVARKNCSVAVAATPEGQQNPQSQSPAQGNCLPKGVIEISENFGVDPEARTEFNQAVVLLNEEKYSEAIRLLKAVSGKTSKFSAPYINLGIAYARTDKLEKAEENFKKALEISKQHPVAHNELGLIYRKTGRYVEARKLYEALLTMYPDFLPARKNLGVLCDIYIQDLSCALEQYEEYLKGIPDDEKVKIWVADVKSRM